MKSDVQNFRWYLFYRDQLLLQETEEGLAVPCGTEPPVAVDHSFTVDWAACLLGCASTGGLRRGGQGFSTALLGYAQSLLPGLWYADGANHPDLQTLPAMRQ